MSPAAPAAAEAAGPPLRICFASAELAPFAKRGGLADVAAALTRYLAAAGHDVRTFVPLYGGAPGEPPRLATLSAARDVELDMGGRRFTFTARLAPLPHGPEVVLIDCPELFGGEIYEGDERDPLRFAVFCRAVLETCRRLSWAPQVFHVHDWHAALLPLYAASLHADAQDPAHRLLAQTRTLLTLHNVGFQGVVGAERLGELALLGAQPLLPREGLAAGRVNLLEAAILHADLLSTVSPTHAVEITTPEGGAGLDGVLRRRAADLVGIVNGVDPHEWDPANDPHLPAAFGPGDLLGKAVCRRELAAEVGLDYEPAAPVAGIVSRLTWQKGFDLTFGPLPRALREGDLRLVVLGTGEAGYEDFFADLAAAFPGRVAFRRDFNEPLAHRIEAGSDLFLMPSRYEPCGLNQMYSQIYGTLPLVRRTGGLADTVVPFVPEEPDGGGGTGFVFEHFTEDGFQWALDLALDTWRERGAWRRMVDRAMAQDFSWQRRGSEYLALYRRLATSSEPSGARSASPGK